MDDAFAHELERRFGAGEFLGRGGADHDGKGALFRAVHAWDGMRRRRSRMERKRKEKEGGRVDQQRFSERDLGKVNVPPDTGASTIPAPVASMASLTARDPSISTVLSSMHMVARTSSGESSPDLSAERTEGWEDDV